MREKQFPVVLEKEQKKKLEESARKVGLSLSAFIRSSSLKESNKILSENKQEDVQAN